LQGTRSKRNTPLGKRTSTPPPKIEDPGKRLRNKGGNLFRTSRMASAANEERGRRLQTGSPAGPEGKGEGGHHRKKKKVNKKNSQVQGQQEGRIVLVKRQKRVWGSKGGERPSTGLLPLVWQENTGNIFAVRLENAHRRQKSEKTRKIYSRAQKKVQDLQGQGLFWRQVATFLF